MGVENLSPVTTIVYLILVVFNFKEDYVEF